MESKREKQSLSNGSRVARVAVAVALALTSAGCSRRDVAAGGAGAEGVDVYTIQWVSADVPSRMKVGERMVCPVSVRNVGEKAISSQDLSVSYHWLEAVNQKSAVQWDGARTGVPEGIQAGATLALQMKVAAPEKPGRYVLMLDMVREGVAWFSLKGAPTLRIEVTVE